MASNALWRKTPLVESRALSEAAGCRIFLKLENLQPSGSFKSRGIGNFLLTHLHTNPSPHFYSSSGGNAGLALVLAAATLGRPATVVVPMTTNRRMMEMIERAGAREVIQYGANWQEADNYLREHIIVNDVNAVYVPPFDNEDVWEGHSSIVGEIVDQLREATGPTKTKTNGTVNGNGVVNGTWQNGVNGHDNLPSAIVCSVGGGGLFTGIMRGLDRIPSASNVDIVAVETHGAASLQQSLAAKQLITLPGITSAANSLGVVRVAEEAFKCAQRPNVHSVALSDVDAQAGCLTLAETDRFLVELACGVNVAVCEKEYLERSLGRSVGKEDKIVVIVCGGSNVTIDMLADWKADVIKRRSDGTAGEGIRVLHGND